MSQSDDDDMEAGMTTAERRRRRRRGGALRVPSDNVPRRPSEPPPRSEDPALAMSIAYSFGEGPQTVPGMRLDAFEPVAPEAASTLIEPREPAPRAVPMAEQAAEEADEEDAFETKTREMSAVDLNALGLAAHAPDAGAPDSGAEVESMTTPFPRIDPAAFSADEPSVDIDIDEGEAVTVAPSPVARLAAAAAATTTTAGLRRAATVALSDDDLEDLTNPDASRQTLRMAAVTGDETDPSEATVVPASRTRAASQRGPVADLEAGGDGPGPAKLDDAATAPTAPSVPAFTMPAAPASPPPPPRTTGNHAAIAAPSVSATAATPTASLPAPPRPAAPPPPPVSVAPPPAPTAQPKKPSAPPAASAAPEAKKVRRGRPWFEEVFDDDYLRTLPFLTPQLTQDEATFIVESLGVQPGAHLLDVACGYGRHAMELASRGFHVVGLDLSSPLLLRGADEAQRRGLNINFIQRDMREMDFEEQFDAAYCWFSSFGYFDEDTNKKTAANVHRALRAGGRLILEVPNRDYLMGDMPTRSVWEGDGCMVVDVVDFNYFSSRLQVNRQVVFTDHRHLTQDISMRVYSLHELGKLMHAAGFRVLEVSGSIHTRGRFLGNQSRSIIVVAEKRDDARG